MKRKLKSMWNIMWAKNYLVLTETMKHTCLISHDEEPEGGLVSITDSFIDDMFDYDELDRSMDQEIKAALKHRMN